MPTPADECALGLAKAGAPSLLHRHRRKRWLVEHGIEIISEASRRLCLATKARHPAIPWPKVAGIGNVLRHENEDLAPDVLWHFVRGN